MVRHVRHGNRQVFGPRVAPANFNVLNHTVVDLAVAECGISRNLVHRHLDDVPVDLPHHRFTVGQELSSGLQRSVQKDRLKASLGVSCACQSRQLFNVWQGTGGELGLPEYV